MSKTIVVPEIGMNPIRIRINMTDYVLTPGETATVPDEVAAVLATAAARPQPDPDGSMKRAATIEDVYAIVSAAIAAYQPPKELPTVTAADNGKLWGVFGGEFGLMDAPQDTLLLTATITGTDVSIDVTPAELAAAVAAKRQVALYAAVNMGLTEPVQVMLPLRQVVCEEYTFVGINSVSSSGGGASIISCKLSPDGGELVGSVVIGSIDVEF